MTQDHSARLAIASELHTRPFPQVEAPCMVAFLALMEEDTPATRDRTADLGTLRALLDHYGAASPADGATHFFGEVGRGRLKWECHTEFVTYTFFLPLGDDSGFDAAHFDVFPATWLEKAKARRLTSAMIRVAPGESDDAIQDACRHWFVSESLAMAKVNDATATLAGDFRIDVSGHMRFALFTAADASSRRIGRIVQRIAEIETYKAASMLGFAGTAELGRELVDLEADLTDAVHSMQDDGAAEDALERLLFIASGLEGAATDYGFRFGATNAYARIVTDRIKVLREERFMGRQTFHEFMMRRFDPAMRTVQARQTRLEELSTRAARAAELLRTKVDVSRSAQNQSLLESMNRRADLQLRLQRTVEGLSVVAISYYAVNLLSYLLAPTVPLDKTTLTGALVLPVVLAVWFVVQRIRKSMH